MAARRSAASLAEDTREWGALGMRVGPGIGAVGGPKGGVLQAVKLGTTSKFSADAAQSLVLGAVQHEHR